MESRRPHPLQFVVSKDPPLAVPVSSPSPTHHLPSRFSNSTQATHAQPRTAPSSLWSPYVVSSRSPGLMRQASKSSSVASNDGTRGVQLLGEGEMPVLEETEEEVLVNSAALPMTPDTAAWTQEAEELRNTEPLVLKARRVRAMSRALPPTPTSHRVPTPPLPAGPLRSTRTVNPPPIFDQLSVALPPRVEPPRSDSRASRANPITPPNKVVNSLVTPPAHRRPKAIPTLVVCTPQHRVTSSFKAIVIIAPALQASIPAQDRLCSIDVGGTRFVVSSLSVIERGGMLGAFVVDSYKKMDDQESFVELDHFEMSPFPSPFPFMRHATPTNLGGSQEDEMEMEMERGHSWLDLDPNVVLPESPRSSVDPARRKFAGVMLQPTLVPQDVKHKSLLPSIFPGSDSSLNGHDDTVLVLRRSAIAREGTDEAAKAIAEQDPFEKGLGSPFFRVLKGQQAQAVERVDPCSLGHGLVIPTLGVTSFSRPPSLSRSLSSDDEGDVAFAQVDRKSGVPRMLELFVDRDGGGTFTAVMWFIRNGTLPLTHVLPHASNPLPAPLPDVDPLALQLLRLNPSDVFTRLSDLRALQVEARWLGITTGLEELCEGEIARIGEVVRWMVVERERKERKRREVKVKPGWI